MAGLGDMVQKAFYLGVGLASYAGEKAGGKLAELRTQAQKLADEMVVRGEMNSEEARKWVDEMMNQSQKPTVESSAEKTNKQPRRIEILADEGDPSKEKPQDVDNLRSQVQSLQDELRRLQND